MTEQTSASISIEAPSDQVMAAIADFDAYPQWASAVKETEIIAHDSPGGRPSQVRFVLNAGPIKDDYRLSYTWHGDHRVSWTLVEASVLKVLDGSYTLAESDGRTEVTYQLQVDVSVPMIGMLKRKAEKMIIDTALKELKKYVEQGRAAPEAGHQDADS